MHAPPLAGVSVPHHIEAIVGKVVQAGERMFELRRDCVGTIRAEPFNETIAAAMPFPVKVYGIIEFRWTYRGKKARLQHIGHELVAGRNDCCFLTLGR